jgi:acyl-coenzyme A thioesterase PaaI-like protein
MNRISRNLSIIIRSERLIARRRIAVLRLQTGLMAAAGVVAGIGLIMLNVAAYLALAENIPPSAAALTVAVVDLAIAAFLVSVASGTNAENEVAGVAEVRDLAMEDLEVEVQDVAEEIKELAQSVRNMARDPLGMVAPGAIGALANILIKNLKK